MKVGYSFWGYISDIEPDSPSGCNFYIPDMVLEMANRGWEVIPLQENRDWKRANELKVSIPFGKNFIPEKRRRCYQYMFMDSSNTHKVDQGWFPDFSNMPKLDLLIIEWRWPIEGRNTEADVGKPGFTPELHRQKFLLDYYHDNTDTNIVILDLDHKLTVEDEKRYSRCHIFETSVRPKSQFTIRERAFLPFDISEIKKHTIYLKDPKNVATYIGNNYERDLAIENYIKPVSEEFPNGVKFVGNWTKYPKIFEEVKERWPNISYEPRIVKEDFVYKYGPSLTCPILAKEEYYRQGFITPRILESLMYGCLPVGFGCHYGIEYFLPSELIVNNASDYINLIKELKQMTILEYNKLIDKIVPYLDMYSPKSYIDHLERIIGTTPKNICL